MKKVIFVAGNPLVGNDSLPVKLISKLQKQFPDYDFVHWDPTEEIPISKNRELIIIDTVAGIKKVTIINDLNHIILSPRVSLHDYDLPIQLGLLKKLKKINKFIIIGIPEFYKPDETLKEIRNILKTI